VHDRLNHLHQCRICLVTSLFRFLLFVKNKTPKIPDDIPFLLDSKHA
jgi:hypothetical protein